MRVCAARIYLAKIQSLHPVLVELTTDEGLVGVGEAAVAYGVGGTATARPIARCANTRAIAERQRSRRCRDAPKSGMTPMSERSARVRPRVNY